VNAASPYRIQGERQTWVEPKPAAPPLTPRTEPEAELDGVSCVLAVTEDSNPEPSRNALLVGLATGLLSLGIIVLASALGY
jgi:hypothetical protein